MAGSVLTNYVKEFIELNGNDRLVTNLANIFANIEEKNMSVCFFVFSKIKR